MLRNQVGLARNVLRYGLAQQPAYQVVLQQNRTAVSLKELKNRMVTIASIKKITNSMNKLATSKLKKAREAMERLAKPYIEVNLGFLKGNGVYQNPTDVPTGKEIILVISTDRGMCGATNSSLLRLTKKIMQDARKTCEFKLLIAGNKGNAALKREFSKQYVATVGDLSKKPVSFHDVEPLISAINQDNDYDRVRIVSNSWISVVATEPVQRTIAHPSKLVAEMKDAYYGYEYDGHDVDELFANMTEHITAAFIYGSLVENTACELAARMNSMDNATTNAGKMHYKLNLLYNRTRQANITTELSEIISGAAAVMEAE